MKTRIIALCAFALVVAACGGTAEVEDGQTRSTAPITTTLAPFVTTAAPGNASTQVGGSGVGIASGATSPQLQIVQRAMSNATVEAPARIEGLIEVAGVDADLGAIEIAIPFSSSFDSVTGDGHMLMDFSGMNDILDGTEVPDEFASLMDRFEVRQIGDTSYLNFGLINLMMGVETPWLSMPVEDGEGFTQDFSSGVNPYDATAYLESLTGSSGDVTVVGTEALRGVETTHYRVVFDLEALAQLDPDAFAELQGSAPIGFDELPMDLWIDDQERVHRYLFEIDQPDIGDLNPGESFEYMRVQFDFSDYGGRVTVEPPPADQVTDVSEIEDWFGDFAEGLDV